MRVLLNSTNLLEVIYYPGTKILEICFHSGHVYRYSGVPKDTFEELVDSDSAGRYYNHSIKGQFPSMRWF